MVISTYSGPEHYPDYSFRESSWYFGTKGNFTFFTFKIFFRSSANSLYCFLFWITTTVLRSLCSVLHIYSTNNYYKFDYNQIYPNDLNWFEDFNDELSAVSPFVFIWNELSSSDMQNKFEAAENKNFVQM